MMEPDDDSQELSRIARTINDSNNDILDAHVEDLTKLFPETRNKPGVLTFDPYVIRKQEDTANKVSLLDEDDETDTQSAEFSKSNTPGTANFLEMEEAPLSPAPTYNPYESIRTSSGLLLTHRRTPLEARQREDYNPIEEDDDKKKGQSFSVLRSPVLRRALHSNEFMEVEHPWTLNSPNDFFYQTKRILSYMKISVIVSAAALILGTGVLLHHLRSPSSATLSTTTAQNVDQITTVNGVNLYNTDASVNGNSASIGQEEIIDRVILLPLQRDTVQNQGSGHQTMHRRHRKLSELWGEFEAWAQQHSKSYHSIEEKERRFQIWTNNHFETMQKNERHGPCRMTKQPVFGPNQFKDLTTEEFKAGYLTGYTGPKHDELEKKTNRSSGVMGNHVPVEHHPEVRRRLQAQWKSPKKTYSSSYNCKWYDLSCSLEYIYDTYLYGIGSVMEPAYDADAYPLSVDWRDVGAVTQVHSQGNCGACWAIVAVETIESAVFLKSNTLYDLSETEIIVCADECEMCSGGWPQDAFDYVMEHKGVPLESDLPYNGDTLLELTKVYEGQSSYYDLSSYKQQICPNGEGGSADSDNSNNFVRYGKIDGYGYATERCKCYTDGSGCECNSQNEGMAVRNVATYGPAVVCLDASTWKDYNGGIITSASGCSQQFLDVNHCVQVVGYAFSTSDEGDGEKESDGDKNEDSTKRQGYWIVRNQWSRYWGMNGYAYVSMGENTCGILNDMIQVYA